MSTNNLALPVYQKVGRPARMSSIIGQNVARIRSERGLSPQKLADEIGVALFTIQQIEKGVTQKSKFLPDIARVLKVPLGDIDPAQTNDEETAAPIPRNELLGDQDVPVYASVEAGEGVLVMSNSPVDRADRPASLRHVRDAYGILVSGDSMSPLVRPGDTVVVHPHKHPRPYDLCVFRGQEHGDFRGLLKEFVGSAADTWKVKRYFPKEKEYVIKKKDWPECHVVVTIHRR